MFVRDRKEAHIFQNDSLGVSWVIISQLEETYPELVGKMCIFKVGEYKGSKEYIQTEINGEFLYLSKEWYALNSNILALGSSVKIEDAFDSRVEKSLEDIMSLLVSAKVNNLDIAGSTDHVNKLLFGLKNLQSKIRNKEILG